MAANYLLGKGTILTEDRRYNRPGRGKIDTYDLATSQEALLPQALSVAYAIANLPSGACPSDEGVAAITLHPSYLSKSYFPDTLIDNDKLRAIGSRPRVITPRRMLSKGEPVESEPTPTTEIFVAGKRSVFRKLAEKIPEVTIQSKLAADLIRIEEIRFLSPEDRIQPPTSKQASLLMEIVLHTGGADTADSVRLAFRKYLKTLGISIDLDERIDAGLLSFVAVNMPRKKAVDVAKFSFLRAIRDMPKLRQYKPTKQIGFGSLAFSCSLPRGGPIDPSINVACFDGGIPEHPALRHTVVYDESFPDLDDPVPRYVSHGLGVTSALLFGPLQNGKMAPQPYARLHHHRVLDVNTSSDPEQSLYPVLRRIESVLKEKKFDFVNLSIGPDLPLQDEEVHPWTAKLDELLSDGKTLVSVAVGNSGEADNELRYNRIQPPADCVNALAVGACDSEDAKWKKTDYSSIGYGRSPGFVKPDGIAFGGTPHNPFWVLSHKDEELACPEAGTSFAAPYALRAAIGVRAQLGTALSTLSLKTLLIHSCERNSRSKFHKQDHVGWGRICTDVEKLITCANSAATVIYEGKLIPRRVLRAQIPMPKHPVHGRVTISATICLATETDPQDPIHYTRSGIEVTFRKDVNAVEPEKNDATSDSFFSTIKGMSETELRRDAYKWEPTLHKSKTFEDGVELKAPILDIHFNPREGGRDASQAKPIPYAMIITVSSPDVPDLYNQIVRRYRNRLEPIKPRLRLTT